MSHYDTIGVSKDATQAEIKKAYRRLANKYHPDKKTGDDVKFKEINAAYDIIGDKDKRSQYDINPNFDQQGGHDNGFRHDFKSAAEMYEFMRKRNYDAQTRNQDSLVSYEISLKDAYNGGEHTFNVDWLTETIKLTIPKGVRPGAKFKIQGKGRPQRPDLPIGDMIVQIQISRYQDWDLQGPNLVLPITINAIDAMVGCSKEFTHLSGKKYKVPVPAGCSHGEKLRLSGLGMAAPALQAGTKSGDLYVVILVEIPKILDKTDVKILQGISKKL
jgi:DnaJ-class molecular chaperone